MGVLAFTDASVVIDGNDLSDHVRSVSLNVEAEPLDATAMGATYRVRIGGLKDWSVDVEFNQDFAVSEVDAVLFPLLGSVVVVTVKPTSGAVSATNPSYSGSVLIAEFPPMGNAVGELATVSVSWPGAGALTRATV